VKANTSVFTLSSFTKGGAARLIRLYESLGYEKVDTAVKSLGVWNVKFREKETKE
jgi:hypothetical protein